MAEGITILGLEVWHRVAGSTGAIRIGTSTPNSQLVITSDSSVSGEPKAAATIDAAAATTAEWALNLGASTGTGMDGI